MEEEKIIIYQTEDGQTQIDVRLENETVWLTQAQMVELFQTTKQNVGNSQGILDSSTRGKEEGISYREILRPRCHHLRRLPCS